jgi:hypothetical protein
MGANDRTKFLSYLVDFAHIYFYNYNLKVLFTNTF